MSTYLHPGVYIEEAPGGSRPIEATPTSTAVFVGFTSRGPVGAPVRLAKWSDYERIFGGLAPAIDSTNQEHGDMGLALRAFFLNGGSAAFVVRIAKTTNGESTATLANAVLDGDDGTEALEVEAFSPGRWGNGLIVRVTTDGKDAILEIGRGEGKEWRRLESFAGPKDVDAPNHPRHLLNSTSEYLRITTFTSDAYPSPTTGESTTESTGTQPSTLTLAGGSDGELPDSAAYGAAFETLERNREISIICLPGQDWNSGKEAVEIAIAHAEKVKSRIVLVDPPPLKELTTGALVDDLSLSTSSYAMLYYPWAEVPNPTYDAERNPGAARTLDVAPSAFAAGMFGKIDGRRGVWKAPAGVETGLLGITRLKFPVDDGEQDVLNPKGVNCLRMMPGYGTVIWGARTLATKADPPWRYVPVRRTAIMIEQSVYGSIQWAVFEPNDESLWSALRTSIGSFMNGLFRAGAFQGKTANEAYFVRCGKGDTMTQGDVDAGRVIVQIGFAPLKPAEFVIVRIEQKVAQQ